MHRTALWKVGGSVMLAVPPAILDILELEAGSTVGVAVDGSRLIIEARPRPRYTLSELLETSDYSEPQPPEERAWVDAAAVGREIV